MSREVRRVPLDFSWPLNEVWGGYVMPEELSLPPCPDCRFGEDRSTGYSPEAYAVSSSFYRHQIGGPRADMLAWHDKLGQAEVDMLIENGRLRELRSRVPTEDNPRDWEWVPVPRTAEEVNAANGPGRSMRGSHDGVNRMYLVAFRCERLGIRVECPTCDGKCEVGTDEQRAAHDAWEQTEPPTGDGWQLWETVSEGSPITPVFVSADALARHLTERLGFNPGAARTLVDQGCTVGSFVGVGRALLRSAEDADMVAALANPATIFTAEDRSAAEMEAGQ